jgi:hypothetical protein
LPESFLLTMPPCKLSVIVVCLNSARVREACLVALADQVNPESTEILAVGPWGADVQSGSNVEYIQMHQRFPSVRWLPVSAHTTVPQMRTWGILQSLGEIVALLEDDCVVSDGWCMAVMKAHQRSRAAIGGSIAPDSYRHLLDWAVYFCEYARFMPPFSGATGALPGNHVTYDRAALPLLEAGQGFYEVFFHTEWLKSGRQLIADPALVVKNINQWSLRHITRIPFHHGRAFAGMRAASFPAWRRGLYALLSTGLPAVKVARLAMEVGRRRRYTVEFCLSIPWIMIFLTSWSLGELWGYAAGPGHGADEWR